MGDRSIRRSSKWDHKEHSHLSPELEHSRGLKKLAAWDGDGDGNGGDNARMSPGPSYRRRQNQGHSPQDKWNRPMRNRSKSRSRSRSRSPSRGFRQKSNYDRNKGTWQAVCRDFNSGRCRRGNDCPLVHQGNKNFDNIRECRDRKGGMLNYPSVHDATEYPSKSNDGHEREWNRSNDTLCKFFAAGNCRSGKNCRFSHGKTGKSPEANKYREDHKRMDLGPIPDAGKFEENNGRRGAVDQRVNDRFLDGQRESQFENERQAWNNLTTGDSSIICLETRSAEKVLDDAAGISPVWNYSQKTSNHIEDKHHQSDCASPTLIPLPSTEEQDNTRNSLGHMNLSPLVNEDAQFPGIPQSSLSSSNVLHREELGQNLSDVALPNLNAIGLANVVTSIDPQRGFASNQQNVSMFQEGKPPENPKATQIAAIPPNTHNVIGEQLIQLTNISASINQLLEAGKQLPQLYATITGKQPPSEGAVDHDKQLATNVYIALQGQHDHSPDSAEQKKSNDANILKRAADMQLADASNTGSLDQIGLRGSCGRKDDEYLETADGIKEDTLKDGRNHEQTEKENDGRVKDEDGKKNKEAKSVRSFKFSLAEFVKELLKPTWKDGLVGKDAYKTIVKKVVNKVTDSIQGANIPHSQEKIDQYLSVSKPKLTKLVQAYVEKFQKPKK
ncbi:hypothetical protein SAY87_002302 [Trapa incisa]|uniref:C3H1-type domain-containing protein n=1 Tax=Trapa incisa TaxID=236973 RepID=A0AAN7JTV7_9MYRT|nr:hypothetical protein SAY87_002302 [Trapa incisa]